jgi:hypothetical protein
MRTTFGIATVLATGFRIWAKNVIPFLVITAVIYAPVLLWNIYALQGEMTQAHLIQLVDIITYSSLLMILLTVLVSAALTYGVVKALHGQRASLGACIATGLARCFSVLGVGVLVVSCVVVATLTLGIPAMKMLSMLGAWRPAIIAGTVVLVLPALIVYGMVYVSPQVALVERTGVLGALRRSRALVSGHKLEIIGLIVGLGMMSYALQKLVAWVTFAGIDDVGRYVYALLAVQLIAGSISAVMASVAYAALRAEKDGTPASALAAILDEG